jgi:hypothetical protein
VTGRLARMTETVTDGATPAESMVRLCSVCATELDVTAAGVALIVSGEHRGSLGDSGGLATVVEDLQYATGEGPCLDAHRTGEAVGEPALAEGSRWPTFTPAALAEGVRAVFAFPLQVGGARFGALDLYRQASGALSDDDFVDALAMAEVANGLVLDLLAGATPGELPDAVSMLVDRRAVVHQAVGMVSVQLGVGVEDAQVALRAKAFADGRKVVEVAEAVVARRERLDR